jgi:hypothetical protein
MKKLFFFLQFLFHVSFSQDINWSTLYEQENSTSKLNFIGTTNSEIFMLSQEGKGIFSTTKKYILLFNDSTLLFKNKVPIEIENNNQLTYIKCLVIGNQLHAFYSKLVQEKSEIYSRVLIDQKWGEAKLICSVPFIESSQINLKYFTSINSLFAFGVRKNVLKKVNEFCALVFNYNSNSESIFCAELNSENANLDFMEAQSDTCCNIVLLANYFQKKSFNLNVASEIPVALKLTIKNSECKIINLKSLDASSEFSYLISSNKGILLNRENGKPEISIVNFDNDNDSQILFNSINTKPIEKEEDYAVEKSSRNTLYEKDFKNLKIRNVFRQQDSSITVVCEQSWKEQICNTLNYRFGGVQCFDYFYSMDLFVFYFSAKGELKNMNRFQKPQITIDDGGVYNSIVCLQKNNDVLILFNNEPSNLIRKSGKLKTMMYPMSSVLNSIIVNKNGLVNSQRLSNPKQDNAILRPSKTFYINSSEALVLATKNNKFKIGKIKI